MRFRLIELLSIISVAGVALSALFQPTDINESIVVSGTLLLTLFAGAMAIGRRGAARSFWLAFTLTAVSYLMFSKPITSNPRTWGPEITTRALHWIFAELHDTTPDVTPGRGGIFNIESEQPSRAVSLRNDFDKTASFQTQLCQFGGGGLGGGGNMGPSARRPNKANKVDNEYTYTSFMVIGQCVWALVLAWVMGHIAQFVHPLSHPLD